jgi:dynactin complex subunit
MMLEEFVKLTGVNVSYRYYTENIEPVYMHPGNSNKEEWCAEWVKSHKKNIVKGLVFDIEELSRDVALLKAIKAENTRIKGERDAALKRNTALEETVSNLQTENECLKTQLANLEDDNERLTRDAVRLEETLRELSQKDSEITALKAKLYDMMIAAA